MGRDPGTLVARLGIRLYLDETIHPKLAAALRHAGYEALHCEEVGLRNQAIPDDHQLEYAAREGQAMLTFNVVDFPVLDAQRKAAGRPHAGIIVSTETRDLGELLRRTKRHLDTYTSAEQNDTLLWLA
jgi:predicted nuclease of predicted toxin-antitoxin system